MRWRVWGSREAKRRWGPHFSYLNEVRVKRRWWRVNTYRLRYWNHQSHKCIFYLLLRCNSTYRLRYAPKGARQQRSKATMRSAHLKYLNEEKVKQRWWENSAYRLRYWNNLPKYIAYFVIGASCNNTYRLRYGNYLICFNSVMCSKVLH